MNSDGFVSPTYHNQSQDFNAYTTTSNNGMKTTKVAESNEEEVKGYHHTSDDGRSKTTYEEKTKLKQMRENVTTVTPMDGDGYRRGQTPSSPQKFAQPVMATETRKMAFTETKVCSCYLIFRFELSLIIILFRF